MKDMRIFISIVLAILSSVLLVGGSFAIDFTCAKDLNRAMYDPNPTNGLFEFKARVVHVNDASERSIFVRDETGGAYMAINNLEAPQVGDTINCLGSISPSEQLKCNYTRLIRYSVLSHGNPPPPEILSIPEINRGAHLSDKVQTTGTVVDVIRDDIDANFFFMVLSGGGDTVYVALHNDIARCIGTERLLDATASVTGICFLNRGTTVRRNMGIGITLTNPDDFKVIRPAPADRFSVPPLHVGPGGLLVRSPDCGPRKIRGRVLACWHSDTVLVRTEGNALSRLTLRESRLPKTGTTIEAVGLPETDLYTLNLSRAEWRPATANVPDDPPPERVTTALLLNDRDGRPAIKAAFLGRPVILRGTVRSVPSNENSEARIILESDGHIVPIEMETIRTALASVEIGSVVDIRGICVMNVENRRPQDAFPRIRGISIVITDPDAIRVLRRPPWWTPARLLVVIAVLFALVVVLFIRNRIQRRISSVRIRERTRLAVELHDTIAQNLTGASFEINTAEQTLRADADASLLHLGRASRTLKSCRDELRNCIWDLRNRSLEEARLDEAIRRTVEPHAGSATIAIRFTASRALFTDESAHAVLRIIRELVINAVRHGHATHIRIAGAIDDGRLLFSVADNGTGFDPEHCLGVRDGHFGLQGIRERVNMFDGTVSWESSPDKGTKAVVSLELAALKTGNGK